MGFLAFSHGGARSYFVIEVDHGHSRWANLQIPAHGALLEFISD